ncbi:MAG: hypothetical protein HY473_00685 [Candidatus Sungbacteria bacterium]|uniref:Uncharacterized protein n=1 Tax=Candidatus Sungiibacteriota bacterium TaxID=2750080 RepID=A0A932YXC6_9BACT|nr:hypothetical protein [Candidatus Sungbacteria bacterium]
MSEPSGAKETPNPLLQLLYCAKAEVIAARLMQRIEASWAPRMRLIELMVERLRVRQSLDAKKEKPEEDIRWTWALDAELEVLRAELNASDRHIERLSRELDTLMPLIHDA